MSKAMEEGSEAYSLGGWTTAGQEGKAGPAHSKSSVPSRGLNCEHSRELREGSPREGQAWPDLHFRMVTVTGAWEGVIQLAEAGKPVKRPPHWSWRKKMGIKMKAVAPNGSGGWMDGDTWKRG